jgi:hypothetical protein
MKVGVFGDSFAAKNAAPTAWWQVLKQYGHQVTSFGENGSSINFSAKLIYQKHSEFDFVIWCMTIPGRFSVELPGRNEFFHTNKIITHTGTRTSNSIPADIDHKIVTACELYLKYIFDPDFENIIGKALSNYFLDIVPNLMIVPCFMSPLQTDFNLYGLTTKEFQRVFSDKEVHEIYQCYTDIRVCHMTPQNNQILAKIIANNLKPGIFSTDYSNFSFEDLTINQLVIKK